MLSFDETISTQQAPLSSPVIEAPATDAKFCSIDNPDCESGQ